MGEEECRPAVPALPVARRGMVGGWVGGLALVCGGEDETGHIGAESGITGWTHRIWSLNFLPKGLNQVM